MPIHTTGKVNSFGSPYCVRDYVALNPKLGSTEDFTTLVQTAHELDMKIILDWVANHTSWDHSWIQNPSWYTQNSKGIIIHPQGTEWKDVADLNFDNREMRNSMKEAMAWWVTETSIDGFRCDAADMIPASFWEELIPYLRNLTDKELFFLAEGNRGDHFASGFQAVFGWDYYTSLKNIFSLQQNVNRIWYTLKQEGTKYPDGGQILRFTTNHDESNKATPVQDFGSQEAALAASVITFFLPGIPLLYSGQEVGVQSPRVYQGDLTIQWTDNPALRETYRTLLTFRNSSLAALNGTFLAHPHADVAAFQRILENQNLLILVNTRSSKSIFKIPQTLKGVWKDVFTGKTVRLRNQVSLKNYQYRILQKQ